MTLATESVTSPTSGLVFVNYYTDAVTDPYRAAVLSAEHFLQTQFTDSVTVGMRFDLQAIGSTFSGQNDFSSVPVSYSRFVAALAAHATSSDDFLAVSGLPAADPSQGAGFAIPTTEARILGLAAQSNSIDDSVTLNSSLNFSFGQDAVGVLEHEITEGVFGRVSTLGLTGTRWAPMDLFRFDASGQRDLTGGSDGAKAYFGVDGAHLTSLAYHNSISATGADDGFDLADWQGTRGDAFGPGGPNSPGVISATDLRVLDILGWKPAGSGPAYAPAPDDFSSSVGDTSHPYGQLAIGGSVIGTLQVAGDRDLFAVTFQAGASYTINLAGAHAGAGTLADAYLRIDDASGAVLASNDDIVSGSNPDSRLVFVAPASGTYYVEAGGFADGYTGSYRVSLSPPSAALAGPAGNVLVGVPGGDTLQGGAANDTLTGGANGANYLRGGDGDDVINGGAAFDDINGNQGNDTGHGNAGDDWVVGGKGDDLLYGDAGDDIVWGNLGADTCIGGDGADQVRGGQGDDSLAGGNGADFLSGDRGADTISGGAGADIFHSSQDAGIDKVLDFSLAEGDRVMLDPGTTYTLVQVGADTVVDMGSGNQVILVGVQLSTLTAGWIFLG